MNPFRKTTFFVHCPIFYMENELLSKWLEVFLNYVVGSNF